MESGTIDERKKYELGGMKEGMMPVSMMASLIVAVTLRRRKWFFA